MGRGGESRTIARTRRVTDVSMSGGCGALVLDRGSRAVLAVLVWRDGWRHGFIYIVIWMEEKKEEKRVEKREKKEKGE